MVQPGEFVQTDLKKTGVCMHLNKSNGYWYLRRNTDDGKETIESFGKTEEPPTLYRPDLYNRPGEELLADLPDESADCIITDPPYGIDIATDMGDASSAQRKDNLVNDDMGVSFLRKFADEFRRILKPDSHLYVFTRWDAYPKMREQFIHQFDLNTVIAWDKEMYSVGDLDTWSPGYEQIMHFEKGDPDLYGKRPRNVIQQKTARYVEPNPTVHPTQKPRALMEFLLEKSTQRGDIVLDPFGGSYAVPRAAMRLFRRSVSCEIDPDVHEAGQSLVDAELQQDPEHGCDWTAITNLQIQPSNVPLRDEEGAQREGIGPVEETT